MGRCSCRSWVNVIDVGQDLVAPHPPDVRIALAKRAARRIHTSFPGPATGERNVEFRREFESFMDQLLAEPA